MGVRLSSWRIQKKDPAQHRRGSLRKPPAHEANALSLSLIPLSVWRLVKQNTGRETPFPQGSLLSFHDHPPTLLFYYPDQERQKSVLFHFVIFPFSLLNSAENHITASTCLNVFGRQAGSSIERTETVKSPKKSRGCLHFPFLFLCGTSLERHCTVAFHFYPPLFSCKYFAFLL